MTTYYVSTDGADTDAGTSSDTPFATINQATTNISSAGDGILLKGGHLWREILALPASGNSDSPITIGAYDTDGGRPKVYGSELIATWADGGSDNWYATFVGASDSRQIWFSKDSVIKHGNPCTDVAKLTSDYDWFGDTDILWCYSTDDPDTAFDWIEASARQSCIYFNNRSYITIEDVECAFAIDYGFWCYTGNSHLIFDDVYFHHHGEKNGASAQCLLLGQASYCTVKNSTFHDGGGHNIFIQSSAANGDATGNIVEYNTMYDAFHNSGVDLQSWGCDHSGTIVRYNKIYCTTDYDTNYTSMGLFMEGYSGHQLSAEIYYNLFLNTFDKAILLYNDAKDTKIYNNVICRTHEGASAFESGITIGADASDTIIKNNIAIDTHGPCLYVVSTDAVAECDNNLWYNSVGSDYVRVASTFYKSTDQASYQAATGWDAKGLWEDPLFKDKDNDDYNLKSASPCINAGQYISALLDSDTSKDYASNIVPKGRAPDMGALEAPIFKKAPHKK